MVENQEVTIAKMQKDIELLARDTANISSKLDKMADDFQQWGGLASGLTNLQRYVNELETKHIEPIRADIEEIKGLKNKAIGIFLALSFLSPVVAALITFLLTKFSK